MKNNLSYIVLTLQIAAMFGAAQKALQMIREATDGALEESGIVEAVAILISQRDNVRHYAETFRAKLKELGYNYI